MPDLLVERVRGARPSVLPSAHTRGRVVTAALAGSARSRRRRRLRWAGALVVVLAAVLATAPALGVLGGAPSATWSWPDGMPGRSAQIPNILRDMAERQAPPRFPRVDASTLREVAAAGSADRRLQIVAARGLGGQVCLASGSVGFAKPFSCIDDPETYAGGRALIREQVAGGHRGSVVDYTTIVGLARSDVDRVELDLADGRTIELPLNRWGGFGYAAERPQDFPRTLRAYARWTSFFRTHDKLVQELSWPVQELDVAPSPLCGPGLGPCPEGVRP